MRTEGQGTLYAARWVLPVTGPPLREGAVLVRDGRIAGVGPRREVQAAAPPEIELKELGEAAVLPGFVNAHAHLEYTIFRGLLDGLPFFDWIQRLTELKYCGALDEADFLASSRLGALESLRAGVTTVADHADAGSPVRALSEAGLRGIVYQEVFGPGEDEAAQRVEELRAKIERLRGLASPLVEVGATPHSPYTSSGPLLQAVASLARDEGLPLSIHLAESPAEEAFVARGEGPIAESWRARGRAVRPQGTGSVPYVASTGFLDGTRRAQCVHLVQATAEDLALLASRGAGAALCPVSNGLLGVGSPRMEDALAAGLAVGLGTDSAPSGGSLDLFRPMRAALRDARARGGVSALAPEDVLRAATIGGAASLGLEGEVGSLEPGKAADLLVLDLASPRCRPVHDPVEAVVLAAGTRDVRLVLVDGVVVYESPAPSAEDGGAVIEAAEAAAAKLARAARKE